MTVETDVFEALIAELRKARAAGVPFSKAWGVAKLVVLDDFDSHERKNWLAILNETGGAWRRAYLGLPMTPSEAIVARLFKLREAVYT